MPQVTAQISISLDGFATGPNMRAVNGMGDGGEHFHDWMIDAKTDADARITEVNFASTGNQSIDISELLLFCENSWIPHSEIIKSI